MSEFSLNRVSLRRRVRARSKVLEKVRAGAVGVAVALGGAPAYDITGKA